MEITILKCIKIFNYCKTKKRERDALAVSPTGGEVHAGRTLERTSHRGMKWPGQDLGATEAQDSKPGPASSLLGLSKVLPSPAPGQGGCVPSVTLPWISLVVSLPSWPTAQT